MWCNINTLYVYVYGILHTVYCTLMDKPLYQARESILVSLCLHPVQFLQVKYSQLAHDSILPNVINKKKWWKVGKLHFLVLWRIRHILLKCCKTKYQCLRQVCPFKGKDNSTMLGIVVIPRRILPWMFLWRAARSNWKLLPELVLIVTLHVC